MTMYKPKRRTMAFDEYDALANRIVREVPPVAEDHSPSTLVLMCDREFQPTQNMLEVCWILTDNPFDRRLLQVDGAGDAILIEPVF